ncbi:MAG: hypothetical protein ABJC79_17335, partial [Acidimicrobiia bacterium]
MCGIVAVLRRPSDRPVPDLVGLVDLLAAATAALTRGTAGRATPIDEFRVAAAHLGTVDAALRGSAGVRALLADVPGRARLDSELDRQDRTVREFEAGLDAALDTEP